MAQRADLGRAAERDGPDPQAPRRGLDRLARLRAAHQRRGLGRPDRALEAGPRLRGRRPARPTSPASSTRDTRTRRCGRCSTRSPTRFDYDAEFWAAYVTANRRFRDAVLEQLAPGDTVWIHDYHLMLLPRMLREVAPETRIGFFLHIPFPASELLRILPRRDEVLRGLLGADLLAFQTHADLQHFRASLLRLHRPAQPDGPRAWRRAIPRGWRRCPSRSPPRSSPTSSSTTSRRRQALAELRARYQGQRILLAVDRLDYTKGIPQRLRAFRKLLAGAPKLRGKVTLVQVAVPSRERIPEYERLRHEVSDLVGEVNGEFGQTDWTPIVYMRRGISRSELVALYAAADVGWVTPLRDGMNLVAKEYVACHRGVGRRAAAERVRGGGGGDGRGVPREPLRRGAHGVGPGADPRAARRGAAGPHGAPVPPHPAQQRVPLGRSLPPACSTRPRAAASARTDRPDDLPVEEAVEAFRAAAQPAAAAGLRRHAGPLRRRGRGRPSRPPTCCRCSPAWPREPGTTLALVSGRSRFDLETLVRPHRPAVADRRARRGGAPARRGVGAGARRAAPGVEEQGAARCWSTTSTARRAA